MAEDVRRFIEALINKYGVWRVITAPFLLLPIIVALGLLGGGLAASSIAALLTLLISVVIIVALVGQLKVARRGRLEREKVIVRFAETLAIENQSAGYLYETWEEHVTVSARGDTVIEQWKEILVNPGRQIRVLWVGTHQSAGRPTEAERRRIKVSACDFDETSTGRRDGAGYDLVEVWQESALVVYLYLDQPIEEGRRLKIHFTWVWPGFYRHLLEGGRDDVYWRGKRAALKHLTFSIAFDSSCGLTREMRMRPYPNCPMPRQELRSDRSLLIKGEYGPDGVPSEAGFILDNRG